MASGNDFTMRERSSLEFFKTRSKLLDLSPSQRVYGFLKMTVISLGSDLDFGVSLRPHAASTLLRNDCKPVPVRP